MNHHPVILQQRVQSVAILGNEIPYYGNQDGYYNQDDDLYGGPNDDGYYRGDDRDCRMGEQITRTPNGREYREEVLMCRGADGEWRPDYAR